jgi:hypothetical protein
VALTELADLGVAGTEAFHATNKIRDGALHLDGDKLAVQTLPQVDGLTPLRPGHPPAATRRLGRGRRPASRRGRPGRAQGDCSCISRIEDAKALRGHTASLRCPRTAAHALPDSLGGMLCDLRHGW